MNRLELVKTIIDKLKNRLEVNPNMRETRKMEIHLKLGRAYSIENQIEQSTSFKKSMSDKVIGYKYDILNGLKYLTESERYTLVMDILNSMDKSESMDVSKDYLRDFCGVREIR